MSASVVATPTQQGVTRLPTAAHLRTNLLNGNVRVASQTNTVGGQPAFYEVTGGSITNNVKVALPNITSDDTLVTQNGNINWGGGHTFTQGLNASGPIVTTSSITGSSMSANNLSVSTALTSGGTITSGDTINAKNHVNAGQNVNAGNNLTSGGSGSIGTSLTVGTTGTITGNLTAASSAFQATTTNISHTGDFTFNQANGGISSGGVVYNNTHHTIQIKPNTAASQPIVMVQNNGGTFDSGFLGITTGTSFGLIIGASTNQFTGFHNAVCTQQASHGNVSAPSTYTTGVQGMINDCYACLRAMGKLA